MESHTRAAIVGAAGALDEAATDVDLDLDENLSPDIRDEASGWLRKEAADVRSYARELVKVAHMAAKAVQPPMPDDPAMASEPDGS